MPVSSKRNHKTIYKTLNGFLFSLLLKDPFNTDYHRTLKQFTALLDCI